MLGLHFIIMCYSYKVLVHAIVLFPSFAFVKVPFQKMLITYRYKKQKKLKNHTNLAFYDFSILS